MDVERAFLSKLISQGAVEKIVDRIEPNHFEDEENEEVYRHLVKHWRKYNLPPSKQAIRSSFPKFEFEISKDAFDFLFDRFVQKVVRRRAIEGMRELGEAIDDPERVPNLVEEALEFSRDLALTIPSQEVSRFSDMTQRIERYKERQKEGTPRGIKFGIPSIDKSSVGIRPNQYVSIMAWTNVGKSTFMQFLQFVAYLQGKTPMMISLEMDGDELFDKWDTMAGEFQIEALQRMELDPKSEEKWYRAAERAADLRSEKDIIVIDQMGRCTVEKIYGMTVRYKPDIVGVDYIQLMDKPKHAGAMWEGVTLNSQGLKQNARALHVPILSAAQSNDEKSDLMSVAGSKSIVRDSDIVFALEQDADAERDKEMKVTKTKDRGGRKRAFAWLKWDIETMTIREKDTLDDFPTAVAPKKVKDAAKEKKGFPQPKRKAKA